MFKFTMFKNLQIHIGLRIIKTSFSAALAMLVCDAYEVDFPSLAVVAAVVILQPTLHETIEMSKVRILGSVIGSILGLLFLFISQTHPMIEIFIGVLIILAFSNTFSIPNSGVLGIMAFASIIAFPDSTYLTAINRVINTLIGAGTSVLINFFFPTPPLSEKFDSITAAILRKDIELLDYNIGQILEKSEEEENEVLSHNIAKTFNEANETRILIKREQRLLESSDTLGEDNENYIRRYNALWDLHAAVLNIQSERRLLLSEGISLSLEAMEKMQAIKDILKSMLEEDNCIKEGYGVLFLKGIAGLEKELDFVYNQVNVSDNKEGAFFTVFLANLLIISENISKIENSFMQSGEEV